MRCLRNQFHRDGSRGLAVNLRGGYIGLLILIIVACIITLLFWRTDLFVTKQPAQNGDLLMPLSSTLIEQDLNAVRSAENARQQLQQRYAQ